MDAGADLGSTLGWAGITSLKDANGNAITDFSAVSGVSGFDYREGYMAAVVPLPPTVALLASALAGTAGWRLRRCRVGASRAKAT